MSVEVRALSIGEAVPRVRFEGVVHSVFKNAVNIQGAAEGLLLTLLALEETDLPQGIRLDALGDVAFEGLRVGTRTTFGDGMLGVGEALRIDLRSASIYRGDLSSLDADLTNPAVAVAWRTARRALSERRLRAASVLRLSDRSDQIPAHESTLARQIESTMRDVLQATARYDAAGLARLADLVGLGTGLTPSGDDILTGYLAGLWCAVRAKPERRAFLSAVSELVIRSSERTNDIARTYLRLAARGQVSSRLFDLAEAICTGAGPERVSEVAEAAMQVGHTSGMESVYGLLLGLAAWDGAQRWAVEACQ